MARPRLHIDEDMSYKDLERTLRERGHEVTRTPNPWIRLNASDEEQLMGATEHGCVLFTCNVRDFTLLAKEYPEHGGIVLAKQNRWSLSDLIAALDRMLSTTEETDWPGQVRWLNEWRK